VDVVAVPEMVPRKGFPLPGWPTHVPGWLLFIQCKISNPVIPPHEREAVQALALRAQAVPLVAYRGQHPDNARRKTILYRQLTGPGPKEWAPWAPGEDE